MSRRPLSRHLTTLFAVVALLFSQLALAGYVCPSLPDAAAMRAMAEAGMPCQGMDPVQPVLCHQHAADPGKSFEPVKLPTVGPLVLVHGLELPLPLRAQQAQAVPAGATPQARPPPGLLFLATLRLRV